MRIGFFSLFLALLFFSCQEKEETKFLISEDKMVKILYDLHLADGVLNSTELPYNDSILRAENYYANILAKYNINRPVFDSALAQYTKNPEVYLKIYDKVIGKLRMQESKLSAKTHKVVQDSILIHK